jgi:RNA polymerase sigma-70 factor (ECF subfamily)
VKDAHNKPGETRGENPGSTATSLLDGVRRREAEAWRRLARLYGPLVYGWCRRVGLQATDADDVLQEVFLTVAARVAEFRHDAPDATFRGWLWAITRNKIGDHLRRQARQAQGAGGSEALQRLLQLAEADPPSAPADLDGLCTRALDLIRPEFAERTWQAFWRVVVGRQAPADVAAELGLSRNAVYIARSRVLHRLREVLGEERDFRPPGGRADGNRPPEGTGEPAESR